jgi:hypothetical protein
MARRPTDIVQPNLRIREGLRRELKREADKNRVSLNVEMTRRLERSLEQEAVQSNAVVAGHIRDAWERLDGIFRDLYMQGGLVRAAEALVKQVEAGNTEGTPKAVERVRQAIHEIDVAGAAALRKMHTGADKS